MSRRRRFLIGLAGLGLLVAPLSVLHPLAALAAAAIILCLGGGSYLLCVASFGEWK